jgi:acyl-homoserine-lactone acylase
MLRRRTLFVVLTAVSSILRAQEAEILWDSWDVPHIYASNDAGAFYGVGWAQAESYGHAVLVAFLQTRGEASRYLGDDPAQVDSDRRVRILNVAAVAREWERHQTPAFAGNLAAFVTGFNDYFLRYPERVPEGLESLLPIRISDVLGNVYRTWYLSSGWEDQALPWAVAHGWNTQSGHQFPPRSSNLQAGSNAIAIGASKSRSGRALLLINPHVNFNERWFEANIVTPHMNFTGVTIPGYPAMLCGFNDDLGWAITNNRSVRLTTFDETVTHEGYLQGSKSIPFRTREEPIRVRNKDGSFRSEAVLIAETVHGPVIDQILGIYNPNHVLTLRVNGNDRPGMLREYWSMQNATNIKEFKDAVSQMQVPFLNHIYADRKGHILFQYLGLVPETDRNVYREQLDSVISGTSVQPVRNRYLPYDAMPQVKDPPSGWLQNANDPPWTVTLPEVLDPHRYSPAIATTGAIGFRPQRAISMLLRFRSLGFEDLVHMKQDTHVTAADRVLPDLLDAAGHSDDPLVQKSAGVLKAWDGNVLPTSRGAVLFYEWYKEAHLDKWEDHGSGGNLFVTPWRINSPADTPVGLADPAGGVAALRVAALRVLDRFGALDVPWGEIYRVELAGQNLPAYGGPDSLGVYRVLDHFIDNAHGHFLARYGDAYSMIVEFLPEPHAMALLVAGNSEESTTDGAIQQAKLFSSGTLRTVWRERPEVEMHVRLREALHH